MNKIVLVCMLAITLQGCALFPQKAPKVEQLILEVPEHLLKPPPKLKPLEPIKPAL